MAKKIFPERLTNKELGYLIGLFIGDGYSNYNKKDRHYRVDYYLDAKRDNLIKEYLQRLLLKMGLNPYTCSCRGSTRISSNSKRFMELVNEEKDRIENTDVTDREYVLGALSGFIDSDGYVGNGDIVIVQNDKKILEIFKHFSEDILDIPTRLWKRHMNFKGSFLRWNLRITMGFRTLPHNSSKVNRYGGERLPSIAS